MSPGNSSRAPRALFLQLQARLEAPGARSGREGEGKTNCEKENTWRANQGGQKGGYLRLDSNPGHGPGPNVRSQHPHVSSLEPCPASGGAAQPSKLWKPKTVYFGRNEKKQGQDDRKA